MNCKEFEEIKAEYLQGRLTADQEKEVEAHLEQCSECRASMDSSLELMEKPQPQISLDKKAAQPILDEKQQQRILRRAKYKNRFSMALFLLLLFVVLNVAGSLLSSYYYNAGGEDSRLYTMQKTASILVESAFPNVAMPMSVSPFQPGFSRAGWGHSSLEIKPYFAAKGSYALEKQVGREKYIVGYLKLNSIFSSPLESWEWENNSFDDYLCFYHPDILDDTMTLDNSREVWETLDILPEGTVAEMAVSFNRTYSLDEIRALLSDYDLACTWYAVSTGVEGKRPEEQLRDPLTAFHGVWGMPEMSRNMVSEYTQFSSDNSSARMEYFTKSLQYLAEHEELTRKLYRGNPESLQLKERLQYIEENGVQVYGVVVTGPSKELLKLQDLATLHYPALGEIRLWNWFQRNFEGQLY